MRRTRACTANVSNMASFSIKSFDKKLKEMSSRQDSVQTVSLWLIHHRAHSKTVVNLWLDRVKKAKPDRRLVLFYLANDIIQNSRKKGKEFLQSFSKVLGDGMQYLRDTSIRPSVERVLKIWQERKVFEKDAVQKLLDQLNHVSAKPKPKPKPEASAPKKENDTVIKEENKTEKKPKHPVPANFKTINVTRAIATMQGIEDETERRQTLVTQMRLDASSSEGIKQLKDYAGGNRFSLEFEESSTKYEDLAQTLESESQHRQVLINLFEDGDAYYQAALKEASIIANAYRSFGNRLHSMKKKLDNKIRKFATAEKEAPVSAPKASFLSSGLSGIFEQMNQSPAGTPSRSEQEKKDGAKEGEKAKEANEDHLEVKEGKIVDPTVDHVEVSDMDLDSDSENGADNLEPSTAPQLSDSNSNTSAMSTPKPVPSASALTTPSPKVAPKVPVQTTTSQFGYTMTVNSTEENDTSSPASHDSIPSPDGSPDLNLEIYEGPPTTNALPSNQLGVMTNQSFFSNEPKPGTDSPGPHNAMNLLVQLISKQRRNDGGSVEGRDSPGRGSSTSNTPVREESNSRPLANLLGNLLAPLVHPQGDPVIQQDEVSQSGEQAEVVVQQEVTNMESFDPDSESVPTDSVEAASKLDSGPSTDEEGAGGDNTPEHGLDFAQAPPIIIRSDTSFPRPPISPNFPGQVFQNRPPMGSPRFVSAERMPRFPNEHGIFTRDGLRRPSIEEQLLEEHHLRSPGLRSPRMPGPPVEWERVPPFGPRGNIQPVRESRDPRLRRREQQMMGRSGGGPPFIDRVPPIGMQGRPPGMELRGGDPRASGPPFMERQGPPPVGMREDIRRDEVEREEMIRRRLSVGDERDGRIPIEERERHMWEMGEGRPPLEIRPELRLIEGGRREGPFPFERHERGLEIRERFHPMERDVPHHTRDGTLPLDRREGPHPIELRDAPPHIMRVDMIHPMERRHPMDRPDLPGERRDPPHPFDQRGLPIDRPVLPPTERREPHPFVPRGPPNDRLDGSHPTRGPPLDGPLPMEQRNEFHPPEMQLAPDEVPTSEEESPDCVETNDKPPVGVLPLEQNLGKEFFPDGGDERPPVHVHDGARPEMDTPEEDRLHNELKFNQNEGPPQNEQGPMFRPGMRPHEIRPSDERSAFDIRPEFHIEDRGPAFRPRDNNRPIRPIGGPFGPRHVGPGRFPGPRNFHPNFRPRHFRPRHEHDGGRPRFPPMHGGPRLKRSGPPFHPDQAKRPHY